MHQCCFGADYRKPTRLATNIPGILQWGHAGWPQFDGEGFYQQGHQCSCNPSSSLAKQSNDEEFRTTGTAAYPPAMSRAIAQEIHKAGLLAISEAGSKIPVNRPSTGETRPRGGDANAELMVRRLEREIFEGDGKNPTANPAAGRKPYIKAYYKGKHRPIHDGGGLPSRGRLKLIGREEPQGEKPMRITALVRGMFLQWLGAEDARGRGPKAAYWKLAGNVAERSPFKAEIGAMRVQMDAELVNMGLDPHRRPGDISTEIHFRRLAAALAAMDDWMTRTTSS